MLSSLAGVLFDGFAYGMLLFLLSVGLSVTLGMMNFVNLAHCSFAMVGGYVTVSLANQMGWPFLATLPAAFLAAVAACRSGTNLFQAAVPGERPRPVPADDRHRLHLDRDLRLVLAPSRSRLHAGLPAGIGAGDRHEFRRLPHFPHRRRARRRRVPDPRHRTTRFGAQVRAAVDNQRMARGLGIDVDRVFMVTFALGGGLAGLGGSLAIQMVGLEPTFALTYLVYVLIVVSVGGLGSIGGSFAAATVLGISDMAGKYYFPWLGAFLIYLVMVALLMWRPVGLFGRR